MRRLNVARDAGWLETALAALREDGVCVIEGVLGEPRLRDIRAAMYRARDAIVAEVGAARLERAGENGVLRLMGKFEPGLLDLAALPEVLAIVDAALAPTAILHLQNGLLLGPEQGPEKAVFQNSLHRDFPRHLNGYRASLNAMLAVDPFTEANGATLVVPGSHQQPDGAKTDALARGAVAAECAAGGLLVFDSTLWHAAGRNRSGADRLAINHQYTRSWIKQQIDYVRALGTEAVLRRPPRVQQLLGWHARVVASLDEYYQPEESRLYRKGQG
jgi:ectoine hydroxylase-related dioxygenase (phytanoyl-CoA dioxygenase family)